MESEFDLDLCRCFKCRTLFPIEKAREFGEDRVFCTYKCMDKWLKKAKPSFKRRMKLLYGI